MKIEGATLGLAVHDVLAPEHLVVLLKTFGEARFAGVVDLYDAASAAAP